jgi:hypothetical protein
MGAVEAGAENTSAISSVSGYKMSVDITDLIIIPVSLRSLGSIFTQLPWRLRCRCRPPSLSPSSDLWVKGAARWRFEGMHSSAYSSCGSLNHRLISVHVNWPGGLAGATWPLHDPVGYTEAEKSMCAYGRANFSE